MKVIRKMRGMVAIVLTLVACICLGDVQVYAASDYTKKVTRKNADFTLSAEYGLGGLAYYDMPAMVSVTVECKENFTGMLRVTPEDNSGSTVAYGVDISLSAGETKTFRLVPTTLGNNGRINIEILDEKGKVVYGERNDIFLSSGGDKVSVGILSDDYSALSYFDGIGVEIDGAPGTTSIFELTKENFPEDANALSLMQYLLIDNFDTAGLSDEQYGALKTWVQEGGILILGLGSNYQNVLHCFNDSFITGTLGTLEKKDVTWHVLQDASALPSMDTDTEGATEANSGEQTGEEESTEATTGEEKDGGETEQTPEISEDTGEIAEGCTLNLDCIEFRLEDGESLSENTTEDSVYIKKAGSGRVVVLAYSMGMEPMSSSSSKKSIAKFIMEESQAIATRDKFYGMDQERGTMYSGLNVAALVDTSRKPSAILYGIILLIYVVLVGPVLYLILKALNKREKIWIAVPLVTLVFTAVMYATGFLYRINKPQVSTFTVIQLQEEVKAEKIYTNVVCPKPKEYTVQFAEGYTGFRKDVDDYSYSILSSATYMGGGAISCDYMLKENSKGTQMFLNCSEPFQQTELTINKNSDNNIGTLDSNLTCSTTGFEGTVTNNTCYDLKDVVVTFETYLYMAGDIKKGETITIDSSRIIESNPYGSFDRLYPADRLYTDREMYLRYQVNTMVETSVVDMDAVNKGYIWASIPSYQPDLVKDSDVKRVGCGVLLTSYTAEYSDVTGTYYPNIKKMLVASTGEYDDVDGSLYSSESVNTYSFEGWTSITALQIMETQEDNKDSYRKLADVYAYNVETGAYEQVFVDSDTLSGEELEKYILDNVIMLKFVQVQSGANYYNTYIPRISARGEE